tara:strand:- start:1494 stop:2063 length:570 start_codon:yes stop_codon:yes gene_type:complete
MNDKDKNKIIEFVDNAIKGDNIKYEAEIKDDSLEIKTNSLFDGRAITYNFKIENGTIYFYSSNNRYEEATEKLLFDEMMCQAGKEITKYKENLPMKIIFNKTGLAIADYNLEEFYQNNKYKEEITISNYSVLTRFRLGVKQRDIESFSLTIEDIDETIIQDICDNNGLMSKAWEAEVLSINFNNTMNLI